MRGGLRDDCARGERSGEKKLSRQRENVRGSRARRGWSGTTDLRLESSYVEDGRLHVLVGLNEGATGKRDVPRGGLLNTDGWQKAPLTLRLTLRDSTAASIGLRDGVLFNAEERRSRDLEGERGERKGASCSADFTKCAEEGNPHYCHFVSSSRMSMRQCRTERMLTRSLPIS
jgi:hypothetical protein